MAEVLGLIMSVFFYHWCTGCFLLFFVVVLVWVFLCWVCVCVCVFLCACVMCMVQFYVKCVVAILWFSELCLSILRTIIVNARVLSFSFSVS